MQRGFTVSIVILLFFFLSPVFAEEEIEEEEEMTTDSTEKPEEEEPEVEESEIAAETIDEETANQLFDDTSYVVELDLEGSIGFFPHDPYLSNFTVTYLLTLKTAIDSLKQKQSVETEVQIAAEVEGYPYSQDVICTLIPEIADVTARIAVSPQAPDEATGERRIQVQVQGLEKIVETWKCACIITSDFSLITYGEDEKPFAALIGVSEPPVTSAIALEYMGIFKQDFFAEFDSDEDPLYDVSGTLKGEIILSPK